MHSISRTVHAVLGESGGRGNCLQNRVNFMDTNTWDMYHQTGESALDKQHSWAPRTIPLPTFKRKAKRVLQAFTTFQTLLFYLKNLLLFILCVRIFCLHVCLRTTCVLSMETRDRHWSWELDPGPPKKQPVLLITGSSSSPYALFILRQGVSPCIPGWSGAHYVAQSGHNSFAPGSWGLGLQA